MYCSNCQSDSLRILDTANSDVRPLVTSDAQKIDDAKATRTLCQQCGCVEVHFSHSDTLRRYFREQYDISDTVQNNIIVIDGKTVGKHEHLITNLFPELEKRLSVQGRFLEIACGRGDLTRIFHQKWPGWECTGIDPSSYSPDNSNNTNKGCRFIRDYFDDLLFKGTQFDCIIAHGFLNRSPTLPELLKIRKLSRIGTLLSIEFLVLNDSVFAPYIWDHSHMFTTEVFEKYLAHAGFRPLKKTRCISSVQYLCVCEENHHIQESVRVSQELVEFTETLLASQKTWWNTVVTNYQKCVAEHPGNTFAHFGAGLYNAVLLSLLDVNQFKFAIDEVKTNMYFWKIPVISLEEASKISNLHTMLCCRPAYSKVIEEKFRTQNMQFTWLVPEMTSGCEE